MTTKEKAKQLIDKYYSTTTQSSEPIRKLQAIQCALIAVNEIISYSLPYTAEKYFAKELEFWQGVKYEITKITKK